MSAMKVVKCLLRVVLSLAGAAWLWLPLGAWAASTAGRPEAGPGVARQVELVRLVRQDCGSCHGMTLKGGLGSPLLPENLRDKPVEGLVATVLYGRPGTAMPPWKAMLTEAEAEWIVARLLAGFPRE
jgi:cytochrome c55X